MNKTVELVRLWGEYEQRHPEATIEEFCRHRASAAVPREKTPVPEGQMQPDLNGSLVRLIGRIAKFHSVYTSKAFQGTALDQIEEFGMLVTIFNQKEPIKSEVIFGNILELSSGTNMLIRLMKRGLISEYADKEDKRVKRLRLTAKGEKTLKHAKQLLLKAVAMLVQDLSDDDKQLCLQLLRPIDARFSAIVQKQKTKTFEEIYAENMP
ncbi:DNA-binding transcriptional regulator, MarR family [Chryseolinea serpens]|uniref:DNA-binding transcriptional regulator, MarR family n=1 Tax=Chryseolinea serpens TaxID=947013 RepID=A0A1M5UR72_9BACT|nr:winged helix DNA-binding protein [Chryseolinea serpens]SHH65562.1 DNA-binding transcriptional regulator, MarR family [Chryseolinea serpens]